MIVYINMEKKYKKLTLNISEELHKELKIMTAHKETTMTGLVLDLVKEELKKFKKSQK